MEIWIWKSARRLELRRGDEVALRCPVALGREPVGAKEREGDGRTPEGDYYLCLEKETGKYGKSLGLSYPSLADGEKGLQNGLIDRATFDAIAQAQRRRVRPPWGTALGGEIYLHEGGTASDWTAGCIALEGEDMAFLFEKRAQIGLVRILP